jgi:CMP-N-acetylneuraminic acid synthetase
VLNGKTFLAVIPARGGSKRLPRKNVLDLAGKPLIAWTIEAAKQSKYIDHFVVSTDDQEITDVSKQFGAEVLTRPGELATDTASSVDVVLHSINAQQKQYDYVILLQPTSPLRTAQHIDEAIELLFEKNANAIISVCETDHSPLWSNTLHEDGNMDNFIREEVKGKRSQDLPTYYRLNGAIFEGFAFQPGATDTATCADEAFARREGVLLDHRLLIGAGRPRQSVQRQAVAHG